MADKVLCDKSDLVNVADAVRSKLGVTDTYYVSELSSAIQNIQTGGLGAIDGMNSDYGHDTPNFTLSNCTMKNFTFRDLDSSFALRGNVILENVAFYGGSVNISDSNLNNVNVSLVIFNGCSVTCSQTFYDAFLAGGNHSVDTNFNIV